MFIKEEFNFLDHWNGAGLKVLEGKTKILADKWQCADLNFFSIIITFYTKISKHKNLNPRTRKKIYERTEESTSNFLVFFLLRKCSKEN